MAEQPPQKFVIYIAAPPEKVWEGFTSADANRTIFMGASLETDWKPGSSIAWTGPGPDGKQMKYVEGQVLQCEPPKLLQYTFMMGGNPLPSRVTLELRPETEATQVTVTHDQWNENDKTCNQAADGWPRILSRTKTLIETGKTFKPH